MKTAASANDAGFFETEIAAASRGRGTNDDVINQLELKDPAGFDDSAGEPEISLGRGWISAYAVCGITGVMPYPVLCRTEHEVPSAEALSDAA
jgi:hypothetical protein